MRIQYLAASAVLLAGLTGCSTLSSLNPFAAKPNPKTQPVALVDLKPSLAVRTSWTQSIGGSGEYVFSPASVGDVVYAAAVDGSIQKMESGSGRVVWRIRADSGLTAGVGADATTVAVAGDKGAVFAYDVDGKLKWKAQASSEVLSAPAVGQGLVVVRSVDNRITAYDANTGAKKWSQQRNVPPLTLRSAPGLLIDGTSVYVALPGGKLLALVATNGAPKWEVAVGESRGATELERISDVSGAPVANGGDVCAVSYQGRLACFDAANGTPRWNKDFSSYSGIALDGRYVFGCDDKGVISAYARSTGTSVWRSDKLGYRKLSAPASIGRAIAVGDFEGYVHFLGREDGAMLARQATDGSAILAAPLVVGSNVIFQTRNGSVVALATE